MGVVGRNSQIGLSMLLVYSVEPLLDDKARAHQRYLQTQCPSAKKGFRRCQRIVKKAVDEAKEIWISKVIGDVEYSRDGNCGGTVLRNCRLHFLGDGLLVLSDFRNKMVT